MMRRPATGRGRPLPFFLAKMAFYFLFLAASTWTLADTISGTVQDPSGAVIAGARVEITGGILTQPVVITSDGLGKFVSPELNPGSYSIRVTRDGFEPLTKTLDLRG